MFQIQNTFKDGDSTWSLENLFQCLNVMVKNLIAILHVFSCICCLLSDCCEPPRRVWLQFLCILWTGSYRQQLVPLKSSLLKAGWTQVPQPLHTDQILQSLTNLVSLPWTFFSVSMSFLYWESKTGHSTLCSLTSAKWRWRTASLDWMQHSSW